MGLFRIDRLLQYSELNLDIFFVENEFNERYRQSRYRKGQTATLLSFSRAAANNAAFD
jgi:hypothetical protein